MIASRVICAWCGRWISRTEDTTEDAPTVPALSHGICQTCREHEEDKHAAHEEAPASR